MSATTSLNVCPNIQVEINEAWKNGDSSMVRIDSPMLSFITSPLNDNAITKYVVPPSPRSKTRTVEVRYDQVININETAGGVTNPTCTSSVKRGDYLTTYTIDPAVNNIGLTEQFTVSEWATICRSGGSLFAKKVQMMIDTVVQSRADKTAVELAALISSSKYSTDVSGAGMTVTSDALVVNTKTGTTNAASLSANAIMDIDLAAKMNMYNFGYGIFGAELYKYARAMNVGCCADTGVNMEAALRQYGSTIMFDHYQMAHATASNGYLTAWLIAIGSVAMIEYAQNDVYNDPELPKPLSFYPYMVVDPKSGLTFDVNVSESCGNYYVQVVHTGKTVGLPTDRFPVGHPMRGVVGINKILVTNT